MTADLETAGWHKHGATVWQDPNGRLHKGITDAWHTMRATERTKAMASAKTYLSSAWEYGLKPDRDTWLFTDSRGSVWRLRATHDPYQPFTITLELRR